MPRRRVWFPFCVAWLLALVGALSAGQAQDGGPTKSASSPLAVAAELRPFVETYCAACHDSETQAGGLNLVERLADDVAEHSRTWEAVVRKLTARHMPPFDAPRPDERTYAAIVARLESSLDEAAAKHPRPGRTETFRRLNRTEYENAIRDLLALEFDAAALLPADESSHGFDNVTVGDLSSTLLNRYVAAAQKIARRAIGGAASVPASDTFRIRPDVTQDAHVEGLPWGTRGGTLITYSFPRAGEYEIQVWLMRDRNENVEGLHDAHELEVLLDRELLASFALKPPPAGKSDRDVDANLTTRVRVPAGPHGVGVAFRQKGSSLLETPRQPLNVHYNFYRHPRLGPAVYQVSITGPFDTPARSESSEANEPDDTPSRRRIFARRPRDADDEEACARRLLTDLTRRAYRRPIEEDDLTTPLELYRQGRAAGGFEAGIEAALAGVLVSPHFLFRIERDPPAAPAGTVYRLGDVELASRLSFFLWSSLPDDELLDVAARGELSRPDVLDRQVRRMLADARSQSLATNFAAQWLYLRNLDSLSPDARSFPDFDDNLRQALRQETELFFGSIVTEDRSVLDLLRADYTYLNERLARHYGLPHVQGSRFRRVALTDASRRGGLLRQGSILAVTSYATRTSPVIRGQWVLKNLLGDPPPPPPPDVPALEDNTVSAALPMRERLAQHRANPACAGCHRLMDPIGFALENFDALGRWRETENDLPLDVSGSLPGGLEFQGVDGLEQALLARPELFVRTLTEKLLTFALGRGVDPDDAPAIRRIVREARQGDDRFSAVILGIVHSDPFQLRTAKE